MIEIVEHDDIRPLLNYNIQAKKWELYLIRNRSYKILTDDLEQYIIEKGGHNLSKGRNDFIIDAQFMPEDKLISIKYGYMVQQCGFLDTCVTT